MPTELENRLQEIHDSAQNYLLKRRSFSKHFSSYWNDYYAWSVNKTTLKLDRWRSFSITQLTTIKREVLLFDQLPAVLRFFLRLFKDIERKRAIICAAEFSLSRYRRDGKFLETTKVLTKKSWEDKDPVDSANEWNNKVQLARISRFSTFYPTAQALLKLTESEEGLVLLKSAAESGAELKKAIRFLMHFVPHYEPNLSFFYEIARDHICLDSIKPETVGRVESVKKMQEYCAARQWLVFYNSQAGGKSFIEATAREVFAEMDAPNRETQAVLAIPEEEFHVSSALLQMIRNPGLSVGIGNQMTEPDSGRINYSQSAHVASVHESCSQSALRLAARYGSQIRAEALTSQLEALQAFFRQLPNASLIPRAAKWCFRRISSPNYVFNDSVSGVSISQLLALVYTAIHDQTHRKGSLEEAQKRLVQILYEIQRGGNLSEQGVDDLEEIDKCVCKPGTFNKLVEALAGIHADCNISFMTPATAALKMAVVVREEAKCYLFNLAQPKSLEGALSFVQLMLRLKAEGMSLIWPHIKETVADRMFEEFAKLYVDKKSVAFTQLIASGEDLALGEYDAVRAQFQASPGYQLYCSHLMRSSGFFGAAVHQQEACAISTNAEAHVRRPGIRLV